MSDARAPSPDTAEAEVIRLRSQLERVRELHEEVVVTVNFCTEWQKPGEHWCSVCDEFWPCPTIAALGSTETREAE